jgi:carbon monoxide dehydrogenase subunit G
MQLEHSFTVPVGVEEAWRVLLDIERVAPCMPGASLDSVDGDDFTGTVKVKVGPIGLTYKGKASFVEKDEAAHRAVIDAQGKDTRGNGTAGAKVSASLQAEGDSTRVDVVTDLNITGKPAQFGRGVMVDVGNKLIGQFADCLAGKLAGSASDGSEASGGSGVSGAAEASGGSGGSGVSGAAEAPGGKGAAGASGLAGASSGKGGAPQSDLSARRDAGAPAGADNSRTAPATPRAEADVEPIDLVASAGPAIAKRLAPAAAVLLVVLLVLRRRRSS